MKVRTGECSPVRGDTKSGLFIGVFGCGGDPLSSRSASFKHLVGAAEVGPVQTQFRNLWADVGCGERVQRLNRGACRSRPRVGA